jgi:translation initiation factor 1
MNSLPKVDAHYAARIGIANVNRSESNQIKSASRHFTFVAVQSSAHSRPVAGHKKIPLGQSDFGHTPFAGLDIEGRPAPPEVPQPEPPARPIVPARNRGRVDIIRQKAGRGGKTVTVITGFVGIGLPEKESLAKAIQRACGTGGTVKEGRIEIQGDKREAAARILAEAGFRPVFAGG